jgi:hypothetical protein
MFAAVKIVSGLLIGGSLIAAFVESTHPGFVACFCLAFGVGAIAGEIVRARSRRSVRSMARRAGVSGAFRLGLSADIRTKA